MMEEVMQTAQGISEFGVMVVICAVFVVLSFGMMIAIFKWFKSLVDVIVEKPTENTDKILKRLAEVNENLYDISEGMKNETMLRVKNTTNVYLDLSAEKVIHLIRQIKEENHISNKEATKEKIRMRLQNLYEDRNAKWDCYTYRGRRLSYYSSPKWVEKIATVVEAEVYAEKENASRTYNNVKTAYEEIKLEMYHNINS